jgi:hypothetical protein
MAFLAERLRFGPWQMEYAAFFTFNDAGDRIIRLEEMLDFGCYEAIRPKVPAVLARTEKLWIVETD